MSVVVKVALALTAGLVLACVMAAVIEWCLPKKKGHDEHK